MAENETKITTAQPKLTIKEKGRRIHELIELGKSKGSLTDKEIEDMSWLDFVSRIPPKKAELIEYLKEKRLYVNEVVTEGVED